MGNCLPAILETGYRYPWFGNSLSCQSRNWIVPGYLKVFEILAKRGWPANKPWIRWGSYASPPHPFPNRWATVSGTLPYQRIDGLDSPPQKQMDLASNVLRGRYIVTGAGALHTNWNRRIWCLKLLKLSQSHCQRVNILNTLNMWDFISPVHNTVPLPSLKPHLNYIEVFKTPWLPNSPFDSGDIKATSSVMTK